VISIFWRIFTAAKKKRMIFFDGKTGSSQKQLGQAAVDSCSVHSDVPVIKFEWSITIGSGWSTRAGPHCGEERCGV
jgi:hypothetical protein